MGPSQTLNHIRALSKKIQTTVFPREASHANVRRSVTKYYRTPSIFIAAQMRRIKVTELSSNFLNHQKLFVFMMILSN